ncbi:hypothetical protein NBE98_09635 [Clostridium swellfunianum]|uniref:hypothetical protein n=1 Tax=Clostridium swellfunianum TaxID=1367462 RepID=UPI0020308F82|nr:hypothetical protein [Clostridium swellfunianum]MCM0648634.1 hypothetical protein [Clostridium swellfunianum]
MGSLNFIIDDVLNKMNSLNNKVDRATQLYAESAAKKMEAFMKKKAPWTDRTALTRQGLNARVFRTSSGKEIRLSSPTEQFKYLELANEKGYAIAWPTIQRFKGEVIKGWAEMISRIR